MKPHYKHHICGNMRINIMSACVFCATKTNKFNFNIGRKLFNFTNGDNIDNIRNKWHVICREARFALICSSFHSYFLHMLVFFNYLDDRVWPHQRFATTSLHDGLVLSSSLLPGLQNMRTKYEFSMRQNGLRTEIGVKFENMLTSNGCWNAIL